MRDRFFELPLPVVRKFGFAPVGGCEIGFNVAQLRMIAPACDLDRTGQDIDRFLRNAGRLFLRTREPGSIVEDGAKVVGKWNPDLGVSAWIEAFEQRLAKPERTRDQLLRLRGRSALGCHAKIADQLSCRIEALLGVLGRHVNAPRANLERALKGRPAAKQDGLVRVNLRLLTQ
jgi:hypothetical protein